MSDYIGKPIAAYNGVGNLVWDVEYDIYGNIRSQSKGDKDFIPFRNQGQYEDSELNGLMYNRFRYCDGNSGRYISQDPIGYWGGLDFYSYVKDVNVLIDPFGWKDIWFRALRPADMQSLKEGGNIIPKDPTASRTAYEHVLNGSTEGYADQYVSLTKDRKFAESWARKSGNDVVEIDLDKVSNEKIDLSSGAARLKNLGSEVVNSPKGSDGWKVNRWAKSASELLVVGEINNNAVVHQYTPPCKNK